VRYDFFQTKKIIIYTAGIFARLEKASPELRMNYEISGGGYGVH